MALSTLIINADDYGMSSKINLAIVSGVERGLVTSTSIMANMPGFEDAIGLLREHPGLRGRIGVHLNLTEGWPLSQSILACRVFCGVDGSFVYDRGHPLFRLERPVKEAVYEELQTQVAKVIAAGIKPTHLDSHHHVHTEWAIAPLVCRLAKEHRIPRIRLTRNMGPQKSFLKRLYKTVFNRWQLGRFRGFSNTDLFGDIRDMAEFSRGGWPAGKRIEIMVHPQFDDQGELIDLDHELLQARLAPILRQPIILSPSLPELHP